MNDEHPASTPSRWRRWCLWLDRHGWSSWDHVEFEFANYGPLRRRGHTHKETIAILNSEWEKRRPTA